MRRLLGILACFLPLTLAASDLTIDRQTMTRFDPRTALGATIDAHGAGETAKIFTHANIAAMQAAGFQPLSYRLATELAGEAWHWNPRGSWSDAAHEQGYWIASDHADAPIVVSYGYRLPRRGNSIDQAQNDSFSRIDDGDSATFWKSNPHLDGRPQWLLVDLGIPTSVDAIRIEWADPFATRFRVQHWRGDDAINNPAEGSWIDFPHGTIDEARGGVTTLQLANAPITARFVRLLLVESSHTAAMPTDDPRDRAGFAVREVAIGVMQGASLHDAVRHGKPHARQSTVWVSSTDPWHRAIDIDRNMEQPGLDLLFSSGLTRGLPLLTPVALLYGVPEDAAAEIRYLKSRGHAFSRIEMGEEPDGQNMSPEDYATLFLRWADAIHAIDPTLQLGGPAFQSTADVIAFWPDDTGATSWIGRFLRELDRQKRRNDFAFFSFEWYPFDDLCKPSDPQLLEAPEILHRVLQSWREEGLPSDIPWLATEYGYSSFAGEPEVDLTAALFNAEFVAQFLSMGGATAYFYGLEPDVLLRELTCPTYGNLMLYLSDQAHRIRAPLAAYHAARLLSQRWMAPSGMHTTHAVRGTTRQLRAYAVHRPDGLWSLLVINKDRKRAQSIRMTDARGAIEMDQLSPREYQWRANGEKGFPLRSEAPRHLRVTHATVVIPAYSVNVLTFRMASPPSFKSD